jgi:sugar/nucleoside kinase (ribokinase family)
LVAPLKAAATFFNNAAERKIMEDTPRPVSLVVVGSLALDTIATPAATRPDVLGGSVSYACAAASFFTRAGMVAVAGTDFPEAGLAQFRALNIDLQGLHQVAGKTFRWSGVYEQDLNVRRTISTDLNVFADFSPELPEAYRRSPFLFLANIAPALQLQVLAQIHQPRFVAADTMDLWIQTARDPLFKLIAKVDLLLLNDAEARHLTGCAHLVAAARRVLELGPRYVIIKKGEHGSMLFSKAEVGLIPAYPVADVQDPTGAGDSFAGGLMGCLAASGIITRAALRRACAMGSVVASFTVEAFGLDRLAAASRPEIDARAAEFLKMIKV